MLNKCTLTALDGTTMPTARHALAFGSARLSSPETVSVKTEEEIVEAMAPILADYDYGGSHTVCGDWEQYVKMQEEIETLYHHVAGSVVVVQKHYVSTGSGLHVSHCWHSALPIRATYHFLKHKASHTLYFDFLTLVCLSSFIVQL